MPPCLNVHFLQLYHGGAVVKWSLFLNLSNHLFRSAPWILQSLSLSSSVLFLLSPMTSTSFLLETPCTHPRPPSQSIFVTVVVGSLQMPGVLVPLPSSLTSSENIWGSINKPPPIVESMPPLQLSSRRARRSHYLQCVPPRCCLRFHYKLCFFR